MVVDLTDDINGAIASRDGQHLLNLLHNASVNTGEYLLFLAQERLGTGEVTSAVFLLKLLLPAIADEQSGLQLATSFGQICFKLGYFAEARECYLAVGFKPELISCIADTSSSLSDLFPYLVKCADTVPTLNSTDALSDKLDELVGEYLQLPEIVAERQELLATNRALIQEHCHPETGVVLNDLQESFADADIVVIDGRILEKIDGDWHLFSKVEMEQLCRKEHFHLDLQDVLAINCQAVFYLWGCGEAHRVENQGFFRKGRYIVIDFRVLSLALRSISLEPFFDSNFIFNFIDSRTLQVSWHRMFSGASCLPPTQCVWLGSKSFHVEFQGVFQTLLADFKQSLLLSKQVLMHHYEGFQFPKQGKVKVLFLTTRFSTYIQYSIRDLAWGFERNGHETLILKENKWDGDGLRNEYVQSVIASFKPDMIFSIDHLRYEFGFFIPDDLPFVCWVQDLLKNIIVLPPDAPVGNLDMVFLYSRGWVKKIERNIPYKGIPYAILPPSVNSTICHPLPDTEFEFDVSYVGHLGITESITELFKRGDFPLHSVSSRQADFLEIAFPEVDSLSISELREFLADHFDKRQFQRRFVKRLCEKYNFDYGPDLVGLLDFQSKHEGDVNDHPNLFNGYLTNLHKLKPLLFLLNNGIDVKVFGRNWEKQAGFDTAAMGIVDNGDDLNRVTNETKINLSLNSGSSYHMRVPEVIAAGGFILARQAPYNKGALEGTDFFVENKEFVQFWDEEDLLAKVKYYLANEAEREGIAAKASQRFYENYTFEKNVRSLVENLRYPELFF